MADFYSKRTGEQIEALLDIVSQGGGGGGEGSSAYIASFTVEDLNRSLSKQEFIDLADRDELQAAISSNRLVLVPHASSGYGIMVSDLHTTRASVITALGDVYGFYISDHDLIVDPELSTNILDGYATESYVDNAIASAITNVLNTPV